MFAVQPVEVFNKFVSVSCVGVGQSEPWGDERQLVLECKWELNPNDPPVSGFYSSSEHYTGNSYLV